MTYATDVAEPVLFPIVLNGFDFGQERIIIDRVRIFGKFFHQKIEILGRENYPQKVKYPPEVSYGDDTAIFRYLKGQKVAKLKNRFYRRRRADEPTRNPGKKALKRVAFC